mgnify:CR=1 FL=1
MNFPFKKQVPQYPQRRVSNNEEFCEVKIKRDKSGNIISKKISKSCTPQQVRALAGLDGREDNIVIGD